MPIKASTALQRARAYLAERKLRKGKLGRGVSGGPVDPATTPPERVVACCAIGAIRGGNPRCYRSAELAGREYLRSVLGTVYSGYIVAHYNDLRSTTKTDILALFDRAIEKARKEEAKNA